MKINIIDTSKIDLDDANIIKITSLLHDSNYYTKEFQNKLIDLYNRYVKIAEEIQEARKEGRRQYKKYHGS